MASVKCEFKLDDFKWSRSGYAELMSGSSVQSIISSKAQSVLASCTGSSPGYTSKQVQGRLAKGYIVGTGDYASRIDAAKNNTLLRALP